MSIGSTLARDAAGGVTLATHKSFWTHQARRCLMTVLAGDQPGSANHQAQAEARQFLLDSLACPQVTTSEVAWILRVLLRLTLTADEILQIVACVDHRRSTADEGAASGLRRRIMHSVRQGQTVFTQSQIDWARQPSRRHHTPRPHAARHAMSS